MSDFIVSVKEFFSSLLIQFKMIRPSDVIDILILAVILYYCYRFIHERRAGRLAVGILLVGVAFAVSLTVGLNAINFIFRNLFQVGIIALLIIFQPELRAGLERVGEDPLRSFRSLGSQKDIANITAMVETVCDAVSEMSRSKTGALIVIERSTRLGDIIRSGVEIDANVNTYLIRNIFFNKSPLHDGAMIIRNFRICAAGCFLPLTQRADISKNLGTRHRAALGMSEVSDALVIVVSEESGTISCAINGKLESDFNYKTLKQKLIAGLVHTDRESELSSASQNGSEK